jgi:hypothetical protein
MHRLAGLLLLLPALALAQPAGSTAGKGAAPAPAAPGKPGATVAPQAPQSSAAQQCPGSMSGHAGATLTCTCPAGSTSGTVWGSGPYTADSAVCAAALHAGAVPQAGGAVTVRMLPGRQSYARSSRNGISTMSYGSYDASFHFDGVPMASGPEQCPDNMSGRAGSSEPLTCTCPAGSASGTVWGSGPYTADSAVCMAALHAGATTPAGGAVTLRMLPGRTTYAGSSRNGVTTLNYGNYGASFQFGAEAAAAGKPQP